MKKSSSIHYMEKFEEILFLVEKECIAGNKDFVIALNDSYADAKYLQYIFSLVADISLKNYIRRRRLTEAFYSIKNFEVQKLTHTVNGIRQAKKKIIKEFGNNPVKLQKYIFDDVDKQTLENRLKWKLENGVRKREEIITDKLILFSENKDEQCDLDGRYFIYQAKYFMFKGKELGRTDVKDVWMSRLLQKDVFITISQCQSANDTIRDIYKGLSGKTLDKPINCTLDVYFDDGFEIRQLISEVNTKDHISYNINVDKILRLEEDKLILDLAKWFREKTCDYESVVVK